MRKIMRRVKGIQTGQRMAEHSQTGSPLWRVLDEHIVCQAIGRTDITNQPIFEHDIIRCKDCHGEVLGIVRYKHGYFYLSSYLGYPDEYLFNCKDIEVLGNIYDGIG